MPSPSTSTAASRRRSRRWPTAVLATALAFTTDHNADASSPAAFAFAPSTAAVGARRSVFLPPRRSLVLGLAAEATSAEEAPKRNSGSVEKKTKKSAKSSDENGADAISSSSRQHSEPCNVVFTHTNADFDSLAAAVALSLLWSSSTNGTYPALPTHVVLPRGAHPSAQRFLAFHKHLLPLRGFKTILKEDVRAVGMVDAQSPDRIGRGKGWLEGATSVHVFDHHEPRIGGGGGENDGDGKKEGEGAASEEEESAAAAAAAMSPLERRATTHPDSEWIIDKVGSTTTMIVERLRDARIKPAPHEATLFVLGIRADTGGLAYEGTTVRDAAALLWCLENGASQKSVSEFSTNRVSEEQRSALNEALRRTETATVRGLRVSSAMVSEGGGGGNGQYVAGMAQVCEELLDLTDSDVFLLGAAHQSGSGKKQKQKGLPQQWLSVIGRASPGAVGVDLNAVMQSLGGGGHPKAAAAALRCATPGDGEEGAAAPQDSDEDLDDDADLDARLAAASSGQLSASDALAASLDAVVHQIPEQLVASSFMVPKARLITVDADATVDEARRIFDEHGLKSAPVVDTPPPSSSEDDQDDDPSPGKRFRGSLKLNDLVKAARAGRNSDKIRGMVRSTVETVSPDASLAEVEELMIRGSGAGRIPVVNEEDGTLEGIVTRTDVLRQRKLYDEDDFLDQ